MKFKNIKTTDCAELIKGNFYYLENGQKVYLTDCAITQDLKTVFLVVPLYEGYAFTASCDGGIHCEHKMPYEHEGNELLVYSLFAEAPVEKLDTLYQARLKEIERLALAAGLLKNTLDKMNTEIGQLERVIKESEKQRKIASSQFSDTKAELEKLQETVKTKKTQLSNLEDSITKHCDSDFTTIIDAEELLRLKKRDFKLHCLEKCGVDNWEFYEESIQEYQERYPEC